MKLKEILGYCFCKGCKNRYTYDVELKAGNVQKKNRICEKHAKELLKNGTLKSVTFEETILL